MNHYKTGLIERETRWVNQMIHGDKVDRYPLWVAYGVPSTPGAILQIAPRFSIRFVDVVSLDDFYKDGETQWRAMVKCSHGDTTRIGGAEATDSVVAVYFAWREAISQLMPQRFGKTPEPSQPNTRRHIQMSHLYEIREDIVHALDDRDEDGKLDDTRLKSLFSDFKDKLSNCIAYIKNLRAEEDILKAEIKRLQARLKAVQNKTHGTAQYVKGELMSLELKKIDTGLHKVRIQNSPLSVEVSTLDHLPEDWIKVERKAIKSEIIAHLKDTGEIMPGVTPIYSTHLRYD